MKQADDEGQQPSERLSVDVERLLGGGIVVRVHSDLRGPAIAAVRGTVTDELARWPRLLVLDFSGVTGFDMDGVNALSALAAMAGESDIGFCLVVSTGGEVEKCIAKAHLTELFEIFPSVTAALLQDYR